jgi:hypothetical protein
VRYDRETATAHEVNMQVEFRRLPLSLLLVVPLTVVTAHADDVTGANKLLCSSGQLAVCFDDGTCDHAPPSALNVPAFIEVDLVKKQLSTTPASGQNRVSPIRNLERTDGRIVLQGVEGGRAFSLLIDEQTGALTAAVARDGLGVIVFGNCTLASAAR